MTTITQHGIKWEVRENTSDGNIIFEVFNIPMYDLSKFKNVKTCLDIGAHIGSFTVKVKQQFPDCAVWAFEPVEENYLLLVANVKDLTGITACHNTVSGDRLPGALVLKDAKNTGSNIFEYGTGIPSNINTHIKEIQDTLGYIDLLKIDCEGGENSIFENIDFSKIGGIIAELHSYGATKSFEEIFKQLEDAGFKTLHKVVINAKISEYVGIK